MLNLKKSILIFTMLSVLSYGCSRGQADAPTASSNESDRESVLEKVKERGKVNCGVSGDLPGFSDVDKTKFDITDIDNEDSDGTAAFQKALSGFDVDVCKAIAVAIFNDPTAVSFRFLNTQERFEELGTGKIDVLSRTTTWTLERDVSINIEFAPVVFYDGQGVLVKKGSGIESFEDLSGKRICVETETTNENNIRNEISKTGINYEVRPLGSKNEVYNLYESGGCEGVTSDRSQLAATRTTLDDPDSHVLLPEVISKEPLAPAVIEGDVEWLEIVRWVVFSLIEAEELGISQSNLEEMKTSPNPQIVRFLGSQESGDSIGARLKLSPDFTQNIIREVGNYGDIYERNLGANSSTPIERNLNNLWNNSEERGLIYSPPF